MKSVGIFGLGNFGTALTLQLAKSHDHVLAWTKEPEIVNTINEQHYNPIYLSDLKFGTNIKATTDLAALSELDQVVVALPAIALTPIFTQFKPNKNCLLISATKGLDPTSNQTPLTCACNIYSNHCRYAVISGPGFAKDIAAGKPAGLVAAAKDIKDAEYVASMFSSGALRVYASNDPTGVELGGIIKNVIAIAAGISDGLNLGDSARAGIITRGLAEMVRLATKLGAQQETLMGLSGMGDLVLTATCDSSRNRTTGIRLGRGEKLADIIASLGSVAEGVMATKLVLNLAAKYNINMPISEQVALVLEASITPRKMLENLMSRPLSKEW